MSAWTSSRAPLQPPPPRPAPRAPYPPPPRSRKDRNDGLTDDGTTKGTPDSVWCALRSSRLPVVPSSRVHFLSHTLPSLMRLIRLLPVALLAALAPIGAQTTG